MARKSGGLQKFTVFGLFPRRAWQDIFERAVDASAVSQKSHFVVAVYLTGSHHSSAALVAR